MCNLASSIFYVNLCNTNKYMCIRSAEYLYFRSMVCSSTNNLYGNKEFVGQIATRGCT